VTAESNVTAEEYLGEAVEEPIEELIYNAIALTKLDFAQEDLCVPLRGASASRSSRKRTKTTKNRLMSRSDRDGRTSAHRGTGRARSFAATIQ